MSKPITINKILHHGHYLNAIYKDIFLRFKILQGKKVTIINGFACFGPEIENKAKNINKFDSNKIN